jgi:16S rRNA (guanine527-N7)-methyltransferase
VSAPGLDREGFAARYDVSRETLRRLQIFDDALLASPHNLIARSTIPGRWARHYSDSAQLYALIPTGAKTLVDLGSGAGFPGLVLAAMGAEGGLHVTLIEATGKKAAFLAEAAAAMGLSNVAVLNRRIEAAKLVAPDVITARALAPLPALLALAGGIAGPKTVLILPKGQDVAAELTEAAKSWHMATDQRPSDTSPDSAILLIRNLTPKRGGASARTGTPR